MSQRAPAAVAARRAQKHRDRGEGLLDRAGPDEGAEAHAVLRLGDELHGFLAALDRLVERREGHEEVARFAGTRSFGLIRGRGVEIGGLHGDGAGPVTRDAEVFEHRERGAFAEDFGQAREGGFPFGCGEFDYWIHFGL